MGLFNNYLKEGKGVSKNEVKYNRFATFFRLLWQKIWKIFAVNLIYIFACLPIVTIGPATAGMTYVMRNLSNQTHTYIFSDFYEKAKKNFLQSLIVFIVNLIFGAALVYSYLLWASGTLPVSSSFVMVAKGVLYFVAYVFLCMNFYIYPMLVTFKLSLKQLYRNSLILAVYAIKTNIPLFIIMLLIILGSFFLFPYSVPFLLFFVFSLSSFIINYMTYPVLLKYVADKKPEEDAEDFEEPIFTDTVK